MYVHRGSFVFIFVILCCASIVSCYNVDTRRAIRHEGPRNSMFGFTVAAHYERGNSMVLVGAPEAQTSQAGVTKGGAVYRCETARENACYQIPFDQTGDYELSGRVIDKKSHQWFGSTLYSAGRDGPVVACASRYVWFSTKYERRDPVGTCYIARNYFRDFSEYSPCRTSQWGYHRQGSCQAGFSAAISKDGNNLFVGAPGNCYWQGRMYSIDAHAEFPYRPSLFAPFGSGKVIRQSLHSRPSVVNTKDGSATDDDSYLGYSMTVGNFTGEGQQGMAAGMPRGGSLLGKVLLYTWNLTNFMNITGRQMGSYFGYAIAAADVDGDQYDDLIIGAPLFTTSNNEGKYEVGRVYVVYQNSEQGRFMKLDELDGINSKSRFGLSLTSLGDINLDGYMDFAVGAPYDGVEGRGAVYIFHGSMNGVQGKYTQVIYAEDVGLPTPSTFGFSLAGGLDLDQNDYPDTVVGAYLSDATYFLRSRPVVKVTGYAQFQTMDKEIDLESKTCRIHGKNGLVPVACTTITTCLSYTGVGVPRDITFQLQYVLDTQKKKNVRMFFLEGNTPLSNTANGTWNLLKDGESKCTRKDVYIKEDIRDKLTPLDVEVTYQMDSRHMYGELPPVLDLTSTSLKNDSISVRKNCGTDNICVPDLGLEVKPNVERYLLASNEVLIFDITVSNNGEDSFETTFSAQIPEDVNFTKIDHSGDVKIFCREISTNYTIVCDIGNPLPAKKIANFRMNFKPHYKEGMKRFYVFNMEVTSANPEDDSTSKNNKVKIELPIWVNSRLELKGASRPSEVHYNWSYYAEKEKVKHEREIGPQVIHLYTITNNGPSSINEAEVLIFWPYATASGEDLMYLLEPPHVLGNVRCEGADFNYQGYQVERRNKTIWETFDIDVSKEEGSTSSTLSGQDKNIQIQSSQSGIVVEQDEKKFGTTSDETHFQPNGKSDDKYEKATGDASEILREREEERIQQSKNVAGDSTSVIVTTGGEDGRVAGKAETFTQTYRNTSTGPGGITYTYTENRTIVRGPHGEILRNVTTSYGDRQSMLRRSNDYSISGQHGAQEQHGARQGHYGENQGQRTGSQAHYEGTRGGSQVFSRSQQGGNRNRQDESQSRTSSVHLTSDEMYEPPYSSVEFDVTYPDVQNKTIVTSHHQRQSHGPQTYSRTYNRTSETTYVQPAGISSVQYGGKSGVHELPLDRNNDEFLLKQNSGSRLNEYNNQEKKYGQNEGKVAYNEPRQHSYHRTHSTETLGQYDAGDNRNYQHHSSGSHGSSYRESHRSQSGGRDYDFRFGNDEEPSESTNHNRNKRQASDLTKEVQCKAVQCKYVRCFVGPMVKDQDATIALRTRINVNTLKNISSTHGITFSTMMVGRITSVPFIGIPSEKEIVKYEVPTKIAAPEPDTKPDAVPLWVVVLSAIAGALILLLLIFLFYKCGFFKRHRPSNVPERQPLNRNGHYSSGDEAL